MVGVREDRLRALGCAASFAPGCCAFRRTISRSENCSCTMQVPGQSVIGRFELLREERAEVPVGSEEDLLVRRDRADDLLGVRGGHDDVRERLHGRRAVDVGQRDGAGMLLAPGAEGLRRAGVLERAAGLVVRQYDFPCRIQDLGGLRHEPDAGEGDDRGVARLGLAGQVERVADEVREVLDGLFLVVVGEQDCVFLSLERADLGLQVEARVDRGDVRRRRVRRRNVRKGWDSRGRGHGSWSITRAARKRFPRRTRNSHGWHEFCYPIRA